MASVLQSTFRRVCSPSWAALINLVCEAVSSALVNVRYYLPESLLLNLDKSRGKRKSPIKGKALKPPAGAATADGEGLDTMSGPLTAKAAPGPLVYCLICKGFHPNMRPEHRNIRPGTVPSFPSVPSCNCCGSSQAVAAEVEVSLPKEKCSSADPTLPSASHTQVLHPQHLPKGSMAFPWLHRSSSPSSVPEQRQLQRGTTAGQPGLISKADGLKNVTGYRRLFV